MKCYGAQANLPTHSAENLSHHHSTFVTPAIEPKIHPLVRVRLPSTP